MKQHQFFNPKLARHEIATIVKYLLGTGFHKSIKQAWQLNLTDISNIQKELFLAMYSKARKNIPYYAARTSLYTECTAPDTWQEFLGSLPIVTKKILRTENEQFVLPKKAWGTTYHTTSGSSGTPIRVWVSPTERAYIDAILNDWYQRLTGMSAHSYPPKINLSGFMTPPQGISRVILVSIFSK